jgi:hypothetical protein
MEIERLDNEVVLDFPAAFEAQPSNFKKSKRVPSNSQDRSKPEFTTVDSCKRLPWSESAFRTSSSYVYPAGVLLFFVSQKSR